MITVSLCPAALDHRIQRPRRDLKVISIALAEIADEMERGNLLLLSTSILSLFADDCGLCWQRADGQGELMQIYQHLAVMLSRPSKGVLRVRTPAVPAGNHPLPTGTTFSADIHVWTEEMGKLLRLHDEATEAEEYFVGLVCPQTYFFGTACGYPADVRRAFPLVGPDASSVLLDSDDWDIPQELYSQRIETEVLFSTYRAIGGSEPKREGPHYCIEFPGGHKWPFSRNSEFVPDDGLRQISAMVRLPEIVIKHALKTGRLPARRHRLWRYCEIWR